MRYILIIFALLMPTLVNAQTSRNPCYNTTGQTGTIPNCIGVGTGNPLPVTNSGSSTLASSQVTVAATTTQVAPARIGRTAVSITNTGTSDVYCGGPSVTIANGDLLTGTKGAVKSYQTSAAVYCIVGTGTQLVTVAESY